MIDYGTKTLSNLLDYVKNMSVDEYNSAYEEALKDFSEFNSIKVTSTSTNVQSIDLNYLDAIKPQNFTPNRGSSITILSSAA